MTILGRCLLGRADVDELIHKERKQLNARFYPCLSHQRMGLRLDRAQLYTTHLCDLFIVQSPHNQKPDIGLCFGQPPIAKFLADQRVKIFAQMVEGGRLRIAETLQAPKMHHRLK